MQVETLKDVLHWTTGFHKHLRECLSHCSDKHSDVRVAMILSYLSDHERILENVVGNFESSGDPHVLKTWCVEYIHKYPIIQHDHCEESFAELNISLILEVVVEKHQQVIELYRYLASRADLDSAKDLLERLSSLEEHEIMRMVHSVNRFADM